MKSITRRPGMTRRAEDRKPHFKRVTHFLHKAHKGRHPARCIHLGHEERWDADERTINFFPATGDSFTVKCAAQHEYRGVAFAIPQVHVQQLTAPVRLHGDAEDLRKDEVSRRLLLRIFELSGAGNPDWNEDASIFDRRTLVGLTAYVDEHLRIAPSLSDMSMRVGMSPSHFAKKFRHSTGLSMDRFVNRRRIWRSLETLKIDSSLASVALDLGFSSQSHFTRIFSGLTGMTPAKYREQFKRRMG